MMEDWNWTVGQIVAPFGIKGEMKVRLDTDFPERFAALKQVCLRPTGKGGARLFDVQSARLHKGQVLLKVAGLDTIEGVDAWRGAQVQIRRTQAVPLPEGDYYVADIVGFEVVTRDGRVLGKLDKVLPYPAQDLLQVGDALIPAVKEMVLEVDTAARRIVVDPPEGLLPGEEPEHAD